MEDAMTMAASAVNPLAAVGSVASGALGLIGQGLQNSFARQEAEKQREWNESMLDKQNAWSLEQWNRTNEYNSPVEQVKRMQEAGLNPMFYGLDGSSASSFESAQALGYDRAALEQMQNPIAAGVNAVLQQKELEVKQAQIDNLNQNTAKQGEETLTETERRQNMILERDKLHNEIENLIKTGALTDEEIKKARKDVEFYDRMAEAEIGYKDSLSRLNESQQKRIDELLPNEKELQRMSINDFYKRWDVMQAEIDKMAAETGLTNMDIENYALNHMSNGILGTGISVQNAVRSAVQGWTERRKLRKASKDQNDRLKQATEGM